MSKSTDLLWSAVMAQTGPDRGWQINNLYHHERRYQADLKIVQSLVPAGGRIVEIGSAPCQMTALLALGGHSVAGVDVDPGRVAGIVDAFGLDVRSCDVERSPLPFDECSFDCALLCETFEHLRIDPAFVLAEINRVLKPGAALLLTTPNVYSLPSVGRFLFGHSIADPLTEYGKLRNVGHMGHVREYSAAEVRRFIGGYGLATQSVDFRYQGRVDGLKRRLIDLTFRALPRRFSREIVIVARKVADAPRLAPLVPLPG